MTDPTPTPTALVTGASRGIGAAIALRLARHGWTVFAGVRRLGDAPKVDRGGESRSASRSGSRNEGGGGREVEGEGEVERDCGSGHGTGRGRIVPVLVDVCDAASVERALAAIRAAIAPDDGHDGPRGPFSVVNNAGIAVAGPVEDVAVEAVRCQLDVNVLGVLRVVQAALPLVRATGGRIVNIGSTSGRVAVPYLGPYAASKFALRALTDALRVEVAPWGVAVCLIEPGNVRTPIWDTARASALTLRAERRRRPGPPSVHDDAVAALERTFARVTDTAMDPDVVARAVERALTAPRQAAHTIVGRDSRVLVALDRLLPTAWRDALIRRRLGLDDPPNADAEPRR